MINDQLCICTLALFDVLYILCHFQILRIFTVELLFLPCFTKFIWLKTECLPKHVMLIFFSCLTNYSEITGRVALGLAWNGFRGEYIFCTAWPRMWGLLLEIISLCEFHHFFLALRRMSLEFWLESHWICRSAFSNMDLLIMLIPPFCNMSGFPCFDFFYFLKNVCRFHCKDPSHPSLSLFQGI